MARWLMSERLGMVICAISESGGGPDKITEAILMAGTELFDLTGRACDGVLMAFSARLDIEDRSETVAATFGLFELAAIHWGLRRRCWRFDRPFGRP